MFMFSIIAFFMHWCCMAIVFLVSFLIRVVFVNAVWSGSMIIVFNSVVSSNIISPPF